MLCQPSYVASGIRKRRRSTDLKLNHTFTYAFFFLKIRLKKTDKLYYDIMTRTHGEFSAVWSHSRDKPLGAFSTRKFLTKLSFGN